MYLFLFSAALGAMLAILDHRPQRKTPAQRRAQHEYLKRKGL